MVAWFDSHAHPELAGIPGEVEAMAAAGVTGVVAIGTSLEMSALAIVAAERFREAGIEAAAAIGLHPHDAGSAGLAGVEALEKLAGIAGVAAVGECGLDYFYEHSAREIQRQVFAAQVGLAREKGLALVIHTRDAWEDTFAILEGEALPERVVMHCFAGGPEEAKRSLDLGCFISFSGMVTFKNSGNIRDAALIVPADRMLVETDSPYLAPVPFRGKPNRIANVAVTGRFLAELRGEEPETLAAATYANARTAFAIT